MPQIINVSYRDVEAGSYPHKPNSVLIQITDPDTDAPNTYYQFAAKHHFKFHDVEKNDFAGEFPYVPKVLISNGDAEKIANVLADALKNDYNVVVHCHAGLCRSGAVAEVGVMMGFEDGGRPRIPNLLVKRRLMNCVFGEQYGT